MKRKTPLAATLVALVLLLSCAPGALALDPQRAMTQYQLRTWRGEQGLPQDTVATICQTHDSYLWLGTQEGLVRFDGISFTIFDQRSTPELRKNWISEVLEDRNGNLWIATQGGGVSRMRDGVFTAMGVKEGLSSDNLNSVYEDSSGAIWLGTEDGGLDRLLKGRISVYRKQEGLASESVRGMVEDRDGALWFATGAGLHRMKDGRIDVLTVRNGLPSDDLNALLLDRDGDLWAGTTHGLARLRGGRVTQVYTTREGLSANFVNRISQDTTGVLFVGTETGLNRFDPVTGRVATLTVRDGLPSSRVFGLRFDREGNLWIGTESGLGCLSNGKVLTFGVPEGLPSDEVWTIHEGRSGHLWMACWGGGAARLDAKGIHVVSAKDGLSSNMVSSVFEASDGTVWVGTPGFGLNRLKDGALTVLTTKEGLSSDRIRALQEDRSGTIWIGTEAGLDRVKEGQMTSFLKGHNIRALSEDRSGSLWIASTRALALLTGETLTLFTEKEGVPGAQIAALHVDSSGDLWIGTIDGGLIVRHRDHFFSVHPKQGLYDNSVFQILDDGERFWMSCNKGIFSARRVDLLAVALGKSPSVSCAPLGLADGMRKGECNGTMQPAGWRAHDGRLWFPTPRGAVCIDPRNLPKNEVVPPVLVERALLDDRPLPLGGEIRIPPRSRRLQLFFTALSFVASEKVLFRYRLEGFEEEWTAGTRRSVEYTNLSPGSYTFRVKACNNDGVWNETGATLRFRVLPRFYQTWWFYLLAFASVAGTGAGLQRVRIKQLQRRTRDLETLVRSRTERLREANEQLEDANSRLEKTNALLEEAQEKITGLVRSSSEAIHDIASWAESTAFEVARTIGVGCVHVWAMEEGTLIQLTGTESSPPSLAQVHRAARRPSSALAPQEETLVPITGVSGALLGTLVIPPRSDPWAPAEERLIVAFAHQLASTLELRNTQRELALASEKRGATRRQLLSQGIELLHLCKTCSCCFPHTLDRCPKDGSELTSPQGFLPYRLAGRYRLEELIADGGMGTVFSAHDERLGRRVAVKVIKLGKFSDAGNKLRFEQEAHAVAQIDHPGVIVIHDTGEVDGGAAFLIMELLHGLDLGKLVAQQGPGTPQQVALFLRQTGSALAAAHRRNIVHRDIKPENIFLVPKEGSFQTKVLDFGLAKTPAGPKMTQTGMVVGTPQYMSPEQAQGKSLDAKTDVYSLAAVVFYALTGEHIVKMQGVLDMLIEVNSGSPPLASSVIPGLSQEVDQGFTAAFSKNRKKRPGDVDLWARTLAEELERTPSSGKGWDLEGLARVDPQTKPDVETQTREMG